MRFRGRPLDTLAKSTSIATNAATRAAIPGARRTCITAACPSWSRRRSSLGPAAILLHTDPGGQLPVDHLPRLQDNARGVPSTRFDPMAAGELHRQGAGVVVGLGAIAGKPLLYKTASLSFVFTSPLLPCSADSLRSVPQQRRSPFRRA